MLFFFARNKTRTFVLIMSKPVHCSKLFTDFRKNINFHQIKQVKYHQYEYCDHVFFTKSAF